jgi:mannosyltransferase
MIHYNKFQNRFNKLENVAEAAYRHRFWLLLVVFTIQLLFNLYKIDDISIWHDESFTISTANKPVADIIEVSKTDVNPPLYPVIVHYWMKCFGISEFSVRFLSALAGALASAFLFLFCLRFLNLQAAIFSFLMFFTSYVFFYYAQEARTYSFVLLFVILSNYLFFLVIFEKQMRKSIRWALLLSLVNSCLFYFHFLSCFALIAQVILFPVFAFEKAAPGTVNKIKFNTPFVKSYGLSWLVFFMMMLPFYERFLFLIKEGGNRMWLQKPVYQDLKNCVYEMFNSKEIYQFYIYSAILIGVLLIFKKLRDEHFKLKMLVFAVVSGPVILYINYLVAAYSPIFLLRYVLFTFLGFIITFSYLFSVLKIGFKYKLAFFLLLAGYSFTKAKIPKVVVQDYKNAVKYLRAVKNDHVLISTDLPDIFSYYYDKNIFSMTNDTEKSDALFARGVFAQNYRLNWPDSLDFTNIHDIYYTQSFEYLNDGNKVVMTKLNARFDSIESIGQFKEVHIVHYINRNYKNR